MKKTKRRTGRPPAKLGTVRFFPGGEVRLSEDLSGCSSYHVQIRESKGCWRLRFTVPINRSMMDDRRLVWKTNSSARCSMLSIGGIARAAGLPPELLVGEHPVHRLVRGFLVVLST